VGEINMGLAGGRVGVEAGSRRRRGSSMIGPGSEDGSRAGAGAETGSGVPATLTEAILAETFSRHRDRLWRMVRVRLDARLLGRVDPDDVLQEAYLDASRRIEHYRSERTSSVFLWLRLVVAQTLVDTHRRHLGSQRRDAGREVSIRNATRADASSATIAGELSAGLTTPSQALMRAELATRLEAALDGMNDIDREVLVLRHFEELTNGEVAEVLGLQPKAASIRYVRALARLKAILAQLPGFEAESL
jgi:RNA polymerase sigma-70 factor (ECF subfamily)